MNGVVSSIDSRRERNAKDRRVYFDQFQEIEQTAPLDAVLSIVPWVATEIECAACGHEWVGVYQLGDPVTCPHCNSTEVIPA